MNIKEIRQAIMEIIIPYADCIAWQDFGANGNPCYNPENYASSEERLNAARTLSLVQFVMPKYGQLHIEASKTVAKETGNNWVTYPWLRDAIARLLSGASYDELLSMAKLSRRVKYIMKRKGLSEISSLDEIRNNAT